MNLINYKKEYLTLSKYKICNKKIWLKYNNLSNEILLTKDYENKLNILADIVKNF